ncbi:MAG: hypothetical protein FWC69_03700 [Defluviitaleaceae bacterium]|nr:hypothetical protein [Defluviitaleaceae bacterium]
MSIKTWMPKIIWAAIILGIVALFLTHRTSTHNINIQTYGVLFRSGEDEYTIHQVHIRGEFHRRIVDHGLRGGIFHGRLEIEGLDLLEDIGNFRVTFVFGSRVGFSALEVRHMHIDPMIRTLGMIGFSEASGELAIRIFEPFGGQPGSSWSYDGGLVFVDPAKDLESAKRIYNSFFIH